MKNKVKTLQNIYKVNNERIYINTYIEVQIHGKIDIVTDIEKIIISQKEYEEELEDILIFKDLYEHIEI